METRQENLPKTVGYAMFRSVARRLPAFLPARRPLPRVLHAEDPHALASAWRSVASSSRSAFTMSTPCRAALCSCHSGDENRSIACMAEISFLAPGVLHLTQGRLSVPFSSGLRLRARLEQPG